MKKPNFAAISKRVRKRLNLNQPQFAALLGVSQSTVWRWESEKREPEITMALKLLDMDKVSA